MGFTVFNTAGGSLGAAPGGFDSHTPLPMYCAVYFVPSGITLEKPKIRANFRKHPLSHPEIAWLMPLLLEGYKRPTDLLVLHQLFFAVKVQHLQDWSVTDGE